MCVVCFSFFAHSKRSQEERTLISCMYDRIRYIKLRIYVMWDSFLNTRSELLLHTQKYWSLGAHTYTQTVRFQWTICVLCASHMLTIITQYLFSSLCIFQLKNFKRQGISRFFVFGSISSLVDSIENGHNEGVCIKRNRPTRTRNVSFFFRLEAGGGEKKNTSSKTGAKLSTMLLYLFSLILLPKTIRIYIWKAHWPTGQ